MKNRWKKLAAVAVGCVMASSVAFGFVGCGETKDPAGGGGGGGGTDEPTTYVPKQGTVRSYTAIMPSNWNELNYQDDNDTQILSFIGSSFFEYDYQFDEAKGGKFKADGSINADAIVPGGFTVNYSAATNLEDVTDEVDAKWGYTPAQKEEGGYAYKITLREDLKWDDGTPIDATDFVYSMQQQLDPDFMNMRASTFYNNIIIKNARNYLYHTATEVYEKLGSHGYKSNQAAIDAGVTVYVDVVNVFKELGGNVKGLVDENGNAIPNWLAVDDETEYDSPEVWEAIAEFDTEEKQAEFLASEDVGLVYLEGLVGEDGETYNTWATGTDPEDKDYEELGDTEEAFLTVIGYGPLTAKFVWDAYAGPEGDYGEYFEVGGELDYCVSVKVANEHMNTTFEDVGLFSTAKYELVICLDSPIACLLEDGSLSYEAAYSFASLPLVKKDLYESLKKKPQAGSTLWTTTYNTSVATSASWGPYKLTSFQSGKQFVLERNDNWYGYSMPENKNQYNVTKRVTECIPELNTRWTKFFAGEIDSIGLDVSHKADYRNSKYTHFTPDTGTFGMNLYANLNGLKASGHNSGILAIDDFRKAISLWIDRDDYNATLYTSHQTCYGILGPSYYYDVVNGGVYRDTEYAKKGLLRVYGFTENANGTWTDGTRTYLDYEDAYDAMNGMNRTLAKQLVQSAYEELTANAEKYGYDENKSITLVYGTEVDNDNTRRDFNYLVNMFEEFLAGTPLAGKVALKFDASFGTNWANDFKAGAYEIASGTGFGGGAFDPAGVLQCYLDPEAGLMYSTWWDTKNEQLTFTMPEGDYAGAGQELTMSVYNWYCCLNGIAADRKQPQTFNWGTGFAPESARLQLLSKLEEVVIGKYYSIFMTSEFSASMLGAKFSYITNEYNVFMTYGGTRYMVVNYTDAEWKAFTDSYGTLENFYKAVD